nr:hypothetical protein CFP56_28481 [Quercus suber]
MTSDLYASGFHREDSVEKDAPFFLAELRRRAFIKAYHTDLSIAGYFDCPARISHRYSNTKMPLDLPDDELLASESEFQQARSRLTSEGWSMESKNFQSSTWARVRHIMNPWQDEVSKCLYYTKPVLASHVDELRNLSLTGHQLWNSLPDHLRYAQACWQQPGLSPSIRNMLTILYLSYLHCDFQIHRLLESIDHSNVDALLCIAKNMLATVLHLGQARDRAVALRHDFEFVVSCVLAWKVYILIGLKVLSYGLSSAMVLTSMLATSVRDSEKPLPASIGRAEIVRNLSVFVSHLDTIFTDGNANHTVAMQASSSITRALDEVLEPVAQTRAPPTPGASAQILSSSTPSIEVDGLASIDSFLGPFDDQNFNDWMSSIDCYVSFPETARSSAKLMQGLVPIPSRSRRWFGADSLSDSSTREAIAALM